MSDIPAALTQLFHMPAWREFTSAFDAGAVPHAVAVVAEPELHLPLLDFIARRFLCAASSGEDGCPSCSAWKGGEHPDLLMIGDADHAPGITECQGAARELAYEPFAAPCRLAVIRKADALSLPAANSLLKLTEEPPARGRIMYLVEEDNLIPTIRSRVWIWNFSSREERGGPRKPPVGAREWCEFLESNKTVGTKDKRNAAGEALHSQIGDWAAWLAREGHFNEAADLKNLSQYASKRNLSTTMIMDLLFAVLEEGTPIEEIFGEFREA